jgi:hypothetical protein
MHGAPRQRTWSDLKQTADVDATSITLNDQGGVPIDWQVDEWIIIASTDFDGTHAEKR